MEDTTGFLGWIGRILIMYIGYKLIDRLIRYPHLSGRGQKYIMVTGCDTGFGHETAKRLDRKGYNVFAGCLTEKGERKLQDQSSSRLKTVQLDVTSTDSVKKAYEFVRDSLPTGKGLWGLLNNAGKISRAVGPAEWLVKEDYEDLFAVNLLGVIDMTVTFLPLIKKAKGRIVNTSSMAGRVSFAETAPYSITKYGVEAFSDSIRRQLRGYGLTVHLIEPGFFKTNIVSPETLAESWKNTWERLSPEMREEYGEDFLNQSINELKRNFDKMISNRISDVVDAYEHALCGRFPRARYVVGYDAEILILIFENLPEWAGDWIMAKLTGENRIPAVLRK